MCDFKGCKRKAFIAGCCNVCELKFCKIHRFPEKHNCQEFENYKETLRKEQNSILEENRCVTNQIVYI